jgi:hypothetical protein
MPWLREETEDKRKLRVFQILDSHFVIYVPHQERKKAYSIHFIEK